jgi:cell wall-associated NlpC family hydrolase
MVGVQMIDLHIYAQSFLGKPYIWGGDDPIKGFDCSGFVIEVLKGCGVLSGKIDLSSQQLHDTLLQKGAMAITSIEEGDLVFFGKSRKEITHVGLAISKNLMYEAGSGDSTVANAEIAAQKNAFIRQRPILNRGDLVAVVRPKYEVFK